MRGVKAKIKKESKPTKTIVWLNNKPYEAFIEATEESFGIKMGFRPLIKEEEKCGDSQSGRRSMGGRKDWEGWK